MKKRLFIYSILSLTPGITNGTVQKVSENLYAGIGENALLLILATQAAQLVWAMGKWIIDKYFSEQKDKDAEVRKLKHEFNEFREEVSIGLLEIKNEMRHLGKLPDEEEVLKRLQDRMEFMVFKAARDLGIKDSKK